MFEAINKCNSPGYSLTMSHPSFIHNTNKDSFHTAELNVKVLGYLDDTTWFSHDIESLNNMLAVADYFYNLANIKVNKDKTELITNIKSLIKQKTISITFGTPINVKILSLKESERILGVYINGNNSKQYTYNKITKMIQHIFLVQTMLSY